MITRRLGAILAADVVGYSAMMERDEEGTAAQIRTLRREVIEPALNRHQGRLIKTTGDGQGTDLLETRVWDALSDRVIMASYSVSRSFRTAAI